MSSRLGPGMVVLFLVMVVLAVYNASQKLLGGAAPATPRVHPQALDEHLS